MKTATKILLSVAAALVVAGIVCLVGVLAANNWKLDKLGSETRTETIAIAEDFNDIAIEADTENISFVPSGDGSCRVVFELDEKQTATAKAVNGVLEISVRETRKWFEFSLFSIGKRSITVYLPKAEYGSLNIKVDTGDIRLPEDFGFASVGINTDTGDIDCLASVKGRLSVETDTGYIKLNGIEAEGIGLEVSTGLVELTGVKCSGELAIEVSTGRTVMTDVTCGSLRSEGSTGDMIMQNVIVGGSMRIERSTGDIKMTACDAAEIEIETDTGSVTGTLLTEKVFIASSDTGRVSVPETVTGGRCRITTDTGSIKIEIVNG